MARSTRILFVAGEVAPFTEITEISGLTRSLPEALQEVGDYDARLMMPRYGTISERKHNLHEVIRLSGTPVPMGDEDDEVTVKVASIPDTRVQVYFMDHEEYFGRDAVYRNEDGDAFDDNPRRAAFFNRAVIETVCKLRWGPEVIHAFGWISGLVPLLLATEFADQELLENTKVVFTPDELDEQATVTDEVADALGLDVDNLPASLTEMATRFSDIVINPPSMGAVEGASVFTETDEDRGQQLADLYTQMLSEVPA
ncbi:MAG: glycogen synthase [Bacteroidetes bacterium]|jgi:starch synthase|nr:glycogen synthase [Bacteroidota bacterium]